MKTSIEAFNTRVPKTPEAWAFALAEASNSAARAGAKADKETWLPAVKAIADQARQELQSTNPAEVSMNYLLALLSKAAIEKGGLITWEEGLQAIRMKCIIVVKEEL